MAKQRSKRKTRDVTKSPRARRARKRRQGLGGPNPLVWLAGVLGIVVMLVLFNLWQSGTFAKPPTPSRAEAEAELLPLAEPQRPLQGGHDMARIPRQTPAPQPAPAGVALPKLELASTSHDFGGISKRPDVAHIFAVQNTGTADLVLSNLVTSCGCTRAELSSSIIPPGERADLLVIFDPDFHETNGDVVRLVWFATNDPTLPWAEVRITAYVQ
jgi:hypothetical protein